ncbi:hypothetical protein [Nitrospira calida]|jgi:hypothetical protein
MKYNLKHFFYEELYELINSSDALRDEIWALCSTVDYVLLESPRDQALVRLGVIERHLGETEQTQRLRALAVALWPPPAPAGPSRPEA